MKARNNKVGTSRQCESLFLFNNADVYEKLKYEKIAFICPAGFFLIIIYFFNIEIPFRLFVTKRAHNTFESRVNYRLFSPNCFDTWAKLKQINLVHVLYFTAWCMGGVDIVPANPTEHNLCPYQTTCWSWSRKFSSNSIWLT